MKNICMIFTGGTIIMERQDGDGPLVPSSNNHILSVIPELEHLAAVESVDLFREDSSDLMPYHWKKIADAIVERYSDFDGLVVVHGTDTMAYSASALSFALQGLCKPIVFTGSQIPIGEIGSDGKNNVLNAVRVATSDLAEVCITFGPNIIRGVRSHKISEFALEAFVSLNAPYRGKVGLDIRWEGERKLRGEQALKVAATFLSDVTLIKAFPGLQPEYLERFVTKECKGVVIEGFGAGNLPSKYLSFLPLLEAWCKAGKTVIISTQCLYGTADYEVYRGGNEAKKLGALTSFDMTSETAIVKLMWVLGQTSDPKEIKKLYCTDLVGGIGVIAYRGVDRASTLE